MKKQVQCQQPELVIRMQKTTVKVGGLCGGVALGRVLKGSRRKVRNDHELGTCGLYTVFHIF